MSSYGTDLSIIWLCGVQTCLAGSHNIPHSLAFALAQTRAAVRAARLLVVAANGIGAAASAMLPFSLPQPALGHSVVARTGPSTSATANAACYRGNFMH